MGSATKDRIPVDDHDRLRAGYYALISRALACPPNTEFLDTLATLNGDESVFGKALVALADKAAAIDASTLEDEYTRLFYGQGQGGEVLPYASYYLTGNLHDRPLADLRGDMQRLGIRHGNLNHEPEDHIAFLFEMMHGLITGAYGSGITDQAAQRAFFDRHISDWAGDFFSDLEAADSSDFYGAVADLASAFLDIEAGAFELAA